MWTKLITELTTRVDLRGEDGQTLAEYSLILVLISIVSIGVMAALGTDVGGVFTDVSDALSP